MPKEEEPTTIESEFARLMGLETVTFTNDDRKQIAKALIDTVIVGSGHMVMTTKKGIKRLDAKHVKIKLD